MLMKLNAMRNKKGFTLMELLIVVAIIAVLVAIMIPTFAGSLTKAKAAADQANLRAAYADAMVQSLDSDGGDIAATTVKDASGANYKMQAASSDATTNIAVTSSGTELSYAKNDVLKIAITNGKAVWSKS